MEQKRAIGVLSALAQDARLAVVRLLVRQGPEGMSAGAIAERLDIPAATLSFHLTQLGHANLVEGRREGRFIIYSANMVTMHALLTFLLEDCCQGNPEQCALEPVSPSGPTDAALAIPESRCRTCS